MFSPDAVVGEISDPQGALKVGNVGDTECVFIQYKGLQDKLEFSLVYTARELSSLLATAKKGQELAPKSKPRSTIRLGALPPKPHRLQIVLVVPENKTPLLILRFISKSWKRDFFAQPDALVALFQKAERRAPMPAVIGILNRFGSDIWMIEGQSLSVKDDLSHGTGFFREYMHHREVPEGTVVRAWPHQMGDKACVVAFEFAQGWEPNVTADLPQGQQGEQALADGLVRQSRELHALLSKTMFESGRVDKIWSGKIALTSIMGDILMSDEKTGKATWNGEGGNPVLKAGVNSLREGSLSPHDTAIFDMISAYYEAQVSEPAEAIKKIDSHMTSAFKYAMHNQPELKRIVLNNWFLMLSKVGKGASSGPAFKTFEMAKKRYDHELVPVIFSLPPGYPWVKTWEKPKTAESAAAESAAAEAAAAASPPTERKDRKAPLPDLPEIPASANTDHSITASMEAEFRDGKLHPVNREQGGEQEVAAWNDDLLAGGEKEKKKKSPLPLILVGLLVVGAPIAYFMSQGTTDPVPSPSPTSIATPKATPTAAPVVVETPTTPQPPVASPLPEGDLLVNGFDIKGRMREQDIAAHGYTQIEVYEEGDKGVARYRGAKGEVIVNFKLPTRVITAIQGDKLFVKDKAVANLMTLPESFQNDKRFSPYKIQPVVDDEGKVRSYTLAKEGIYVPQPILDTSDNALTLSRKVADKNFFESLDKFVANMYFTDGRPLIFRFLGSFETGRLEYLLKQGADPNLKAWDDGNTALHECKNVASAELLLKMGADPTLTNKDGKTPFELATSQEMKDILNPERGVVASPTPSTPATPAPSASPDATPAPSATP